MPKSAHAKIRFPKIANPPDCEPCRDYPHGSPSLQLHPHTDVASKYQLLETIARLVFDRALSGDVPERAEKLIRTLRRAGSACAAWASAPTPETGLACGGSTFRFSHSNLISWYTPSRPQPSPLYSVITFQGTVIMIDETISISPFA
jgi:hypothetical protein